jgi:CubicO group peptidase (beta-lactamase class C family)
VGDVSKGKLPTPYKISFKGGTANEVSRGVYSQEHKANFLDITMIIMKTTCLIISLLLFPVLLNAQTENPVVKLDAYFQEVKRNSAAPGFSVVVVRGTEVIFAKGYGRERTDQSKPMTAQTVSSIGSLTKSFTALAMMQLVEKGLVKLDEPVTTYLPEFRTANPERSAKITVCMLLNNSSGLYGGVSQKWQDVDEALEKLLRSFPSVYLKKEPGSSYEYSNAAFSLAGLLISRVSGLSYPEYLKRYVLQPLEMNRSSTDPADFERLQVLRGHNMGIDRAIPAELGFDSYEMIPAGSMFRSTAADLGHYLIAMLNEGRYQDQQLLHPESIAALWQAQTPFPGLTMEQGGDGKDFHYGLGWMISEVEGRRLIHHGGSTGTMSSMTVLYPEKQLAASILLNVDYNFIDPYRFPSEFSLLNNVFHLLAGEALSDFGNPRIADPSLNEFVLPVSRQEPYLGTYHFNGKGDARNFHGVDLKILRGPEGRLLGQTWRQHQLLSEFVLDFSNEAVALSRNIGTPGEIRFRIRPDGQIDGLFWGGSEFPKRVADFEESYQLVTNETLPFRFYLARDWRWSMAGDLVQARKEANENQALTAGSLETIPSKLEELLQIYLPPEQVYFSGQEQTEIRGLEVWRSQSFASIREEETFQQLVLVNETAGFFLVLTTPFGELTRSLQTSLQVLMDSFVW